MLHAVKLGVFFLQRPLLLQTAFFFAGKIAVVILIAANVLLLAVNGKLELLIVCITRFLALFVFS